MTSLSSWKLNHIQTRQLSVQIHQHLFLGNETYQSTSHQFAFIQHERILTVNTYQVIGDYLAKGC